MTVSRKIAHIVAVDMGYGHLRAAYPLADLAAGEIINANTYRGIPKQDREIWRLSRKFYEFISRFKRVPVIGEKAFELFDKFQAIPPFYPRRDLSQESMQLKQTMRAIRRKQWGKHLIERLSREPLPMINTFFVTAFMAEEHGYPGEIFIVVPDTDISRAWVSDHPNTSKIKYFAPTRQVVERLKMYGVKKENIYFTGFPLPLENLGGRKLSIARRDLGRRLPNLDPNGIYRRRYARTIRKYLGSFVRQRTTRPFTIMFAVGGAGAQREIGIKIVKGLKKWIKQGRVKIILVSGIHNDVNRYFKRSISRLGLSQNLGQGLELIYAVNKEQYFTAFNKALHNIDVLWTKPSELSFYTALGLPIVMSEPIGSQEEFNRDWLEMIGSGMRQGDLDNIEEWLGDIIERGWFAEAAMEGFIEAPNRGTFHIREIIKDLA